MSEFFDLTNIQKHSWPSNVIPIGAKPFNDYDICDGKEIIVKGFYYHGTYYLQEIIEDKP